MSKTAENTAQKDGPAATAPEADTAAQDAEAARLWKEMASKHSDPHGSGAASEDQSDDTSSREGENESEEIEAKAPAADAKPEPEAKPEPTKTDTPAPEAKSDTPPAKADASKDAPIVDDKLWAKADKDPETAALKKLWEKASPEDRPAIEAHQRKYLSRGQEIARNRERLSKRPAAQAPAQKAEDEPLFDPAADEDLKKLKTDYPDVGEVLEKVIGRAVASVAKRADTKIAPLAESTKAHSEVIEAGELAKQGALLDELQPDYRKAVQAEGFREAFDAWITTKSDHIRKIVEENSEYVKNAADVADVFELFKTQTKFGVTQSAAPAKTEDSPARAETKAPAKPATDPAKDARRRQQLQGSASVDNRGPGASAAPDKDDADRWWNHWSAKKAKELSEDRVH